MNETTNAVIKKLMKLEEKARILERKWWDMQLKWEAAYELARKTPEWAAHCAGRDKFYDYGDVVC